MDLKEQYKKVIHFTRLDSSEADIYNLGFGDFNEVTGKINDLNVTNNADRDRVLGTVAKSVLFFLHSYPDSRVVFKGSTPARTRLYNIEISKHWENVKNLVLVEGLTSRGWEPFCKQTVYCTINCIKKNITL